MNASIKNPRKTAQEKTKSKLLTRTQMMGELKPKVRAIVADCDPKTKGFLLDLMRLGQAGIIK